MAPGTPKSPPIRRPAPVGGALKAGTVLAISGIATERLNVIGLSAVRLRAKYSAAGTLSFAFELADGSGVYATGVPPNQALTAATEKLIDIPVSGEGVLRITLTDGGAGGTLTFLEWSGLLDIQGLAAETSTPVATTAVDVQGLAAAAGLRLYGFEIRESAGTPAVATFILRHGTAATDPAIALVELAADSDDVRSYRPRGIAVPNGVFIDRVAGEAELVLHHGIEH